MTIQVKKKKDNGCSPIFSQDHVHQQISSQPDDIAESVDKECIRKTRDFELAVCCTTF